jgi:hypothetical protein
VAGEESSSRARESFEDIQRAGEASAKFVFAGHYHHSSDNVGST